MENKKHNKYEVPEELKKKRQHYKNYKELCDCFCWEKPKGTNQRQAQLKVLEQYFTIIKQGHKLILTPKQFITKKASKRDLTPNGILKKAVQKQIVHMVYDYVSNKQDVNDFINLNPSINMVISKNELMRSVWLMNDNTITTYGNELVVSDMLQLDYDMFYDNYNRARENSKLTIDRALKGLSRILVARDCFECVLLVEDDSDILEYTEDNTWVSGNGKKYRHYITTEKHYDFIRLVAYPEVLSHHGMKDIKELYSFSEFKISVQQFYNEVNEWIKENCDNPYYLGRYGDDLVILKNIVAHYHKLNISFNDKFIKLEYEELGDLTPEELNMIQDRAYDFKEELNTIAELNIKRNDQLANKRYNDTVNKLLDNTENEQQKINFKENARVNGDYTKVAQAVSEIYINPNPKVKINEYDIKEHKSMLGKEMTNKKLRKRTKKHYNKGLKKILDLPDREIETDELMDELWSNIS